MNKAQAKLFKGKQKQKINKKLKAEYPDFVELIDSHYNDLDWQTLEVDEVTQQKVVMSPEQYEYELFLVLEVKKQEVENNKKIKQENKLVKDLLKEPCGIYGD